MTSAVLESGDHAMTTLLLAEHDNKSLKDATAKALTAAKALGGDVHILVAGKDCKARRTPPPSSTASTKVLVADGAPYAHMLAEPARRADRFARRRLRRHRRARDHQRQERDAARRRAARRHADLRHHQGGRARHLRAADLCRQRHPDRESTDAKKVITVRTSTFQATGRGRLASAGRERGGGGRSRRCRPSSARSCRSRTGRS